MPNAWIEIYKFPIEKRLDAIGIIINVVWLPNTLLRHKLPLTAIELLLEEDFRRKTDNYHRSNKK